MAESVTWTAITDRSIIHSHAGTSHLIAAKFASPGELIIYGELQSCRGTYCSLTKSDESSVCQVVAPCWTDDQQLLWELTESNTESGGIRDCVSRAPNEKSQWSDMAAWACSAVPLRRSLSLLAVPMKAYLPFTARFGCQLRRQWQPGLNEAASGPGAVHPHTPHINSPVACCVWESFFFLFYLSFSLAACLSGRFKNGVLNAWIILANIKWLDKCAQLGHFLCTLPPSGLPPSSTMDRKCRRRKKYDAWMLQCCSGR